MPYHTVEAGECLSKIAYAYGLTDWRLIYDHDENAGFREKRPNPDLIYPGDVVYVPSPSGGRSESGATEQRHRFRLHGPTLPIRIRVGRPWVQDLEGCEYALRGAAFHFEGSVPPDGVIEHVLPIDTEVAELELHPFGASTQSFRWQLHVSELDPVTTVRGVQQRLNNLWFYAGPEDGIDGPMTKTGVRSFQRRHGLVVDGIAGPKTQAKLVEIYGC